MLLAMILSGPTYAATPNVTAIAIWIYGPAGQQPGEDPQQEIVERFMQILERNPRRGTALDRTYAHYAEGGRLNDLVARYKERTLEDAKDASAWMILGLVEAKRGRDARAIEAYRNAETQAPENPLASFYLGQSLMLTGDSDGAAEALRRAADRTPRPADMLEILQALGRVHQRAGRNSEAVAAWTRLEKLFPDDLAVQEQIAETLAEEEQHQEALERYQALAEKAKDDSYQQVRYSIEAADLKLRLGRKADVIADFEALLARLKPDSSLYRLARERIETVFMREEDLAGLTEYYQGWIERNSEDVDAMTRLARTLAMQGRAAESCKWFDQAIRLAPRRSDLRLALIDQLVYEQKYDQAIEQYTELEDIDPNNPDNIRQWGLLILKEKSLPEARRKQNAAEIWMRLVEARPDDAVVATQVADLLRQAELTDEALALYNKAIELQPDQPQYREYLGQYYHALQRPEDAVATWKTTVEGDRRNAENLYRLAEVFAGFGYLDEAIEAGGEACRLDTEDFGVNLQYADLLLDANRHDESLAQLEVVAAIADNTEEREAVLDRRIQNYQGAEQLLERIERLASELKAGDEDTATQWYRLARYWHAVPDVPQAVAAVREAIRRDDRSISAWRLAAKLFESSGDLVEASAANRKLAAIDSTFRTQYLTEVARLEARLGRTDEALPAGRDVIAAAPGNPEHYRFFANLCFQLGKVDEGLDALRRAVRANPADIEQLLALANALARQFMTEEATELYWQALDKSEDIQGKVAVVTRLTGLYLQTNQFDRLLGRLQRIRRQTDRRREMTFCIAQAYLEAQDYAAGREELEELLAENDRDTQLLQQLSLLAEQDGDFEGAIKHQRRLNDLAPDRQGKNRLAQLYLKSGRTEESEALWVELVSDEDEPHRVVESIDKLLSHRRFETVLSIAGLVLQREPDNWEMLYREGVCLASGDRPDEARARFRKILAMPLLDDEQSAQAKHQQHNLTARPTRSSTSFYSAQVRPAWMARTSAVSHIRAAAGLQEDRYASYPPGQRPPAWGPDDFGQARIAASAWLLSLARKEGKEEQFVAELEAVSDRPDAAARDLWNAYYFQIVRNRQDKSYEIAKRLSRGGDLRAQQLYLVALPSRSPAVQRVLSVTYGMIPGQSVGKIPPLDGEELDHMMVCYRNVRAQQPDSLNTTALMGVVAELERAKRETLAEEIYRDLLATAQTAPALSSLLSMAVRRADVNDIVMLMDRLRQLGGSYGSFSLRNVQHPLMQALQKLEADNRHNDVLRLLDHYLKMVHAERSARSSRYRRPTRSYSGSQKYSRQLQIFTASGLQRVQLDYPAPNPYYDEASITFLRSVFDVFDRGDRVDELTAHLEGCAENATDEQQLLLLLGLSYLHWWNEENYASVAVLQQAVDAGHREPTVLFDLAEMLALNGDAADALDALEKIQALGQQTMARREWSAMRFATELGNTDRARDAAKRLFGLQMSVADQLLLAPQLRELGLPNLAEAILRRARRRSGGNTDSLLKIMTEYKGQGKKEIAVQVAYQILRRPPSFSTSSSARKRAEQARQQALAVLAGSGNLDELIRRAESQLQKSPKSVRMMRTLADYYQAANKTDQARELYQKMADLEPGNATFRYQIGQFLSQAGQRDAALEQFRLALKQDPSLYTRNYSQIQRDFESAGKLVELLDILSELGVAQARGSSAYSRLVRTLLRSQSTRERGMELFDKVWKAFPAERAQLLIFVPPDEFSKNPKFYDYIREMVISEAQSAQVGSWGLVNSIIAWSSNGTITGPVSRLLELAEAQDKLDELLGEVQGQLEKTPDWVSGQSLVALIEVRRGNPDKARLIIEKFLADGDTPIPSHACIVIGQELESEKSFRPIVIKMYERAMQDVTPQPSLMSEYRHGPGKRLVAIYREEGRVEDARKLLLRLAARKPSEHFDPSLAAYQRISSVVPIGEELRGLGFPMDAYRIYRDLLDDGVALQATQRFGDRYTKQLQTAMRQVRAELTPENVLRGLSTLSHEGKDPKAPRGKVPPVVDLLLSVNDEWSQPAISSPVARALGSTDAEPELTEKTRLALRRLAEEHPRDFSALVAAALAELTWGSPQSKEQAVRRLVELAEEIPLDPIPEEKRPTFRQQSDAARQLGLWLVARRCMDDDTLKAAGDVLVTRAMEAAERQKDRSMATMMRRELGQAALARGDRQAAESHWRRLLDGLAGRKPPAAAQSVSRPLTPENFKQCDRLARIAIDNRMSELSLACVREGLGGGWPREASPTREPSQVTSTGFRLSVLKSDLKKERAEILTWLIDLSRQWHGQNTPAEDVYEVLVGIVLPESRPRSILAVHRWSGNSRTSKPESIGLLLVEWAIRANRADDLRRRLDQRVERGASPQWPCVMKTQLALMLQDRDLAGEGLDWFTEKSNTDQWKDTAEFVFHVVAPAVQHQYMLEEVEPLLQKARQSWKDPKGRWILTEIRKELARTAFQRGELIEGVRHLRGYRTSLASVGVAIDGTRLRIEEQLMELGLALARDDQLADALAVLAYFADEPASTTPKADLVPLAQLLWQRLATRSPDDRYRLLKGLILSGEEYEVVRQVGFLEPAGLLTATFATDDSAGLPLGRGLASFTELLIDAASRRGELAALATDARQATQKNLPNAQTLLTLVRIAQGETEPVRPHLESVLDDSRDKAPDDEAPAAARKKVSGVEDDGVRWSEYLLTRGCLANDDLHALGEQLAESLVARAKETADRTFLWQLAGDLSRGRAAARGGLGATSRFLPGLAHWHPVVREVHVRSRAKEEQSTWRIGQNDHTVSLNGPSRDFLYFDYPLTGTFDFSVEARHPSRIDGSVAYGGVVFDLRETPGETEFWRIGNRQDWTRHTLDGDTSNSFNRLTIRVRPQSIVYLCNNRVVFENTAPSPTTPWLALICRTGGGTQWQNLKMTGDPTIPREVPLSMGDRLDGWCGEFYGEILPPCLKRLGAQSDGATHSEPASEDYDWSASDGVILGRHRPTSDSKPVQSRLAYHRPLRNGEAISYEFFYQPEQTIVHPALGRVAFQLQPDGVKLHWITDRRTTLHQGVAADNTVEPAGERRGPKQLPLVPEAWNSITLTLGEGILAMRLNDEEIYERRVRPSNGRQFGLFHYQNRTAARVRNVVLKGNWPEAVPKDDLSRIAADVNTDVGPIQRQ
jgi:tetratricopeptide (TPR) repeat protein